MDNFLLVSQMEELKHKFFHTFFPNVSNLYSMFRSFNILQNCYKSIRIYVAISPDLTNQSKFNSRIFVLFHNVSQSTTSLSGCNEWVAKFFVDPIMLPILLINWISLLSTLSLLTIYVFWIHYPLAQVPIQSKSEQPLMRKS